MKLKRRTSVSTHIHMHNAYTRNRGERLNYSKHDDGEGDCTTAANIKSVQYFLAIFELSIQL